MRRALSFVPLLLTVGVYAACSSADVAREATADTGTAPAAPQEVVVEARDFVFQAPDTIRSGVTTFRLINHGPDFHHVLIARLEDGRSVDEIHAHDFHTYHPSWLHLVGGPNTPGMPGEETNATIDLAPGEYALICIIPAGDGEPHTKKGMIKPLTVVPAAAPSAPLPQADLVMVLDDYSFQTDHQIGAGRRTIRIENAADQAHEVLFVRLDPGKTPMDFLQFLQQPEGPPPGKVIGGNAPMEKGEVNLVTLDFEPGEYAMICFVPDVRDNAPHFLHGMVAQITVS